MDSFKKNPIQLLPLLLLLLIIIIIIVIIISKIIKFLLYFSDIWSMGCILYELCTQHSAVSYLKVCKRFLWFSLNK